MFGHLLDTFWTYYGVWTYYGHFLTKHVQKVSLPTLCTSTDIFAAAGSVDEGKVIIEMVMSVMSTHKGPCTLAIASTDRRGERRHIS